MLSPVRADWSTSASPCVISFTSAGTTSPALILIMSPWTISLAAMTFHDPSLRTRLVICSLCFRNSTALDAFCSWMNPIIALTTSSPAIIKASARSPIIAVRTRVTSSIQAVNPQNFLAKTIRALSSFSGISL